MTIAAIDHSGPWTADDVLALGSDGRYRYELFGGLLIVSSLPDLRRRRAAFDLHVALAAAAHAASAPVEVLEAVAVLQPSGLAIPDIVVVESSTAVGVRTSVDAKAVRLVVNLTSDGNTFADIRCKPMLHAKAGIPSYWRLVGGPAPMLLMSELRREHYVEHATAPAGTVTHVQTPFPFSIDPTKIPRH